MTKVAAMETVHGKSRDIYADRDHGSGQVEHELYPHLHARETCC